MAQLSFHENGIHFGSVRVSAEHEAAQKARRYPRVLLILVNVLLLLLSAVVILYSLYFSDLLYLHFGGEDRDIVYTLEFCDASGALALAAQEGLLVTDAENGIVIGTVEAVLVEQHLLLLPDWQTKTMAPTPTGADLVTLTVRVNARYLERDGYYVESIRIFMNGSYHVTVGSFTGQGSCVTLQVNEGEE